MKDISLYELYVLLEKMKNGNYTNSDIKIVERLIDKKERIFEDTSATGGPSGSAGSSSVGFGGGGVSLANASTAGMGGVVSSQPSAFPGSLNGANWINGGGREGSGDISVPYNPSGANRMFQKMPVGRKRKEGDPNVITKKSRHKLLDMKAIKDMLSSKKSSGKIMNFSDFENKTLTTKVTKVKEGRTHDVAKKNKKEVHDISKFQGMIEGHVYGLGAKIKQVGNDFEIHYGGEHIAQVMFREDYIGVKKEGNKFPKEFEYTELGKIKSEITDLIKKATKLNKELGRGWIEKF
jgi:predicted CopG family antitoxin